MLKSIVLILFLSLVSVSLYSNDFEQDSFLKESITNHKVEIKSIYNPCERCVNSCMKLGQGWAQCLSYCAGMGKCKSTNNNDICVDNSLYTGDGSILSVDACGGLSLTENGQLLIDNDNICNAEEIIEADFSGAIFYCYE